jgi:toxin ParE1/3/4
MIGYRFTGPAREDLFEIWEFVARDDIDAADRVIAGLQAAAGKLVAHPQLGRSRPALAAPEIRFLSGGAYLLVYRAPGKEIEILRVLHGARDLGALLGEE